MAIEPIPYSGRSVLRNLIELYLHDASEFDPRDVNEHGLFGYRYVDHYWAEPGRWPFFIRVDGTLAGFALVREESGVFDMAEFFVLRRYRRQGVGEAAARQTFGRFPGLWQVRQLAANTAAIAFWRGVIGRYAGDFEDATGDKGPVQRFEARSG